MLYIYAILTVKIYVYIYYVYILSYIISYIIYFLYMPYICNIFSYCIIYAYIVTCIILCNIYIYIPYIHIHCIVHYTYWLGITQILLGTYSIYSWLVLNCVVKLWLCNAPIGSLWLWPYSMVNDHVWSRTQKHSEKCVYIYIIYDYFGTGFYELPSFWRVLPYAYIYIYISWLDFS